MLPLIMAIALPSYWIKHSFSFYEFELTFSLVLDSTPSQWRLRVIEIVNTTTQIVEILRIP